MIAIRVATRVVAGLTVIGTLATSAAGQTPRGAFERLAPADKRVARSLFQAQRRELPPGSRFTLDDIAAKKSREGWSLVFRQMKAHGLVTARHLAEVLGTRASRQERGE